MYDIYRLYGYRFTRTYVHTIYAKRKFIAQWIKRSMCQSAQLGTWAASQRAGAGGYAAVLRL